MKSLFSHQPRKFSTSRFESAGSRRALTFVTSVSAMFLFGSSFAMAAALPRTSDCANIKNVVQTVGKDLYRYQDPRHPNLQLYNLYVRSDLQCNVGEALEERPVPSLDGCFIPTCVEQDDNGNN